MFSIARVSREDTSKTIVKILAKMIFQTNVNCEENCQKQEASLYQQLINARGSINANEYGFAGGCERVDLRFGWKQSGLGGKW